MKILDAFPPNIEAIKKVFPIMKNAVYTYGDTIYAPGIKFYLPEDLIVHEQTHYFQQIKFLTVDEWWEKYLKNESFRVAQEVMAYKKQYQNFKMGRPRSEFRKFARQLAKDLSGPMYGNCIDFAEALSIIKL